MKILNLYAGIGGNRKHWDEVTDVDVTAVEWNEKTAKIYQDFFPEDEVIIGDAHKYLVEHFEEYDFIWSSPPCPTHSRIRKAFVGKNNDGQNSPVYPKMELYEEILFLQGYFNGKYCVENVRSWYDPLIDPQELASHYFWANFYINEIKTGSRQHHGGIEALQKRKGFDLSDYSGINKEKALRNCVEPEVGEHILREAIRDQKSLF